MHDKAPSNREARPRGDALQSSSRRGAVLFVGAVWLAMLISAHSFVQRYGTAVPVMDDLHMVQPIAEGTIGPTFLWRQLNEHRIPLARLIYFGLLQVSRDVRCGMYFQVYGLGLVSLGLIFAARRMRGFTGYADAFFPLLLLQTGNAFNLLMGLQIAVTLPTLALCVVLMTLASGPTRLTTRSAIYIGLCLVSLPFSSGVGFTQTPVWTLWLGAIGFTYLRSGRAEVRYAGVAASCFAAACAASSVAYLVGFKFPPSHEEHASLGESLTTSGKFLSMNLSYAGREYWPISAWVVVGAGLVAVLLLVRAFRRDPQERLRTSGLLVCMGAALVLALGVGWGRGAGSQKAGTAIRYVTMSAPFLCAAYLTFCRYGPPQLRRFMCVALYSLLCSVTLFNFHRANSYGRVHLKQAQALRRDVAVGLSMEELAARHYGSFYPTEAGFLRVLMQLRKAGMAPFEEGPRGAGAGLGYHPMFITQPESVVSLRTRWRQIEGMAVLGVLPDSELVFEAPSRSTLVTGKLGILPGSYRHSYDLRFTVELLRSGTRRLLFERTLDPAHRKADRELQSFSVRIPEGDAGEIVLGTSVGPGPHGRGDWGCWGGVEIR